VSDRSFRGKSSESHIVWTRKTRQGASRKRFDSEGIARVKSWDDEFIVDVRAMKHDGPDLVVETSDGEQFRVDGREFMRGPVD